jgi:hypothetical protein
MTRRPAAVAILLLVHAATACRRENARAPGVRASAQDTSFVGTTALVQRVRPISPGVPPAMLRAVETAPRPGYDRVVFEFTGDSVPGYRIAYVTAPPLAPLRRCGSGEVVSLAGAQRLVVRFEPARAHDDRGNPAPVERDRAPGLPVVREMRLVCDFEGQVEWALGVQGEGPAAPPYRVSELTGPARLLLDVRHGP